MQCVTIWSKTNLTVDETEYINAHHMSYVYEYLVVALIEACTPTQAIGLRFIIPCPPPPLHHPSTPLPGHIILVKVTNWRMS